MRLAITALALMTAACTPPAENAATADATAGCVATASIPWRPLSGTEFVIDAATAGPDCANATATITVKHASGQTLWTENYPTSQVMTLAPATDVASMTSALAEWIEPATTIQTSSALPELPLAAPQPQNGEFPFYQDEGWDRARYEALRARNVPMFCYVQGMESLACIALENGAMTKVGAQSFPG